MLAGLPNAKVVLLTTLNEGYLHNYVKQFGVITETVGEAEGKLKFYSSNFKKLAAVIKKYNIDIVVAHQQMPALIAGILRLIKRFKLIYIRHNSDEDYQNFPRKARLLNTIVNRLTPIKVAPSEMVKNFWIEKENANEKQIKLLNYGYNFNQYEKPSPATVSSIKQTYPAQLLIISIARLALPKRHKQMFDAVEQLVKEGFDCKLICLGSGPLEQQLQSDINQRKLERNIFLLGRKDNVIDYLQAADIFLHLSSTEASNSAVKEAGLCKKTVIVCKNVGDFDDYIISRQNGFLVSKEDPANESSSIIREIFEGKINHQAIGGELYKTVTHTFDIENIKPQYLKLLNGAA